jgi:Cu(I)/Ag(I) efflux system membrane protein CusA/SilA
MVGGIFTSFLLELLVYPAIYEIWRWHTAVKHQADNDGDLVAYDGALTEIQ